MRIFAAMAFRFKQFSVEDTACTMKVGTDSVLLGAWAAVNGSSKILDIGTGCGILALMAAQRSGAGIIGIDIDTASVEAAHINFSRSPWSERLTAFNLSLQDFCSKNPPQFDHILTNPPFFINSLKAPLPSRNRARHNDELPFPELAKHCRQLLKPEAKLSLVLPVQEAALFLNTARENGLYLSRTLEIRPYTHRPVNRMLMEFRRNPANETATDRLGIRGEDNSYTPEYRNLTKNFYLNF
ncbi:tRNA1(Val) A37 N6-methylase TrmN6 [Lentimicrobium saccharophilum]|uniref:tRNA1(Val) (adenine(37)-N6)-methyltransferase n=1 Tax=Lentimicrobium saccharophilum TaxID=1678841 RepID=A0A0S7C1N3_9BACT|nr:methyltransferase [Lentimicrobium saccharophilum]GAP43072.1 tRNA1(Val) A37 N6-methylase TrmN6 [Lentimicrobium saccharophilum]